MKTLLCESAPPAIELRGLTKRYGASRGIVDVDLRVERGEIFGFIGPNGAGKTTTIRVMLDFIRATSGRATVLGLDSSRDAVHLHRRLGYLPGELQLFDQLTAGGLITWLARVRDCQVGRAHELADRLALDLDRRISDLSAGNRQKIGLIQALMHDPELVILDEPTAGLDPVVQREFRHVIRELRTSGATVFMSSHVLSQVEALCDRVAMIVDGRVLDVRDADFAAAVSRRRVRVVLEGPLSEEAEIEAEESLHMLTGVSDIEWRAADGGYLASLEVAGAMRELVQWAARYEVRDLTSEPVSLDDLFLEELQGAR